MKKRLWWLWVGALLIVYVVVGLWTTAQPAQPLNIPGSVHSPETQGTMSIERLWKQLGLPWKTWKQIPAFLPSASKSVFVSVTPDEGNYKSQDFKDLLQYAHSGHTVIWVDTHDNSLFANLNVQTQSLASTQVASVTAQSASGQQTQGMQQNTTASTSAAEVGTKSGHWKQLDFTIQSQLVGEGLKQARTQYRTASGYTVGAAFTYGQGTVILWSAPKLWENGSIGKADNFRLVWSFVGNRGLLWDEYGHGFAAQSTLGWMFHGGAVYAAILGMLALLLYLYRNLWRFGPVRNPLEGQPMLGTDYMDALGWHLSQRRLRPEQFRQLVEVAHSRASGHDVYRGMITEEVAAAKLGATASPPLLSAWQEWQTLARQGYQPRQWRKFLKVTRRLFVEMDALSSPFGDAGYEHRTFQGGKH